MLPDEAEYTQALSLSRLAYDLENLLSPLLAAGALVVLTYNALFAANAVAFLASALLVVSVTLPAAGAPDRTGGVWHNLGFGGRAYLATPRLRGLLALSFAVAAAGAIVALALPWLLDRVPDRPVMVAGGALLGAGLILGLAEPGLRTMLPVWFMLGAGSSFIQTPTGRLLRRSCRESDRPALFAAHFALSHACWLVTYPLAGWLGAGLGLPATFAILALVVLVASAIAALLWPRQDPDVIEHAHPPLRHTHLHVHDEHHQHDHEGWEGPEPHRHPHRHGPHRHRHAFVIDEHHLRWPRRSA